MYGKGILKGMYVTLRRMVVALTEDARYAGKRYLVGGQQLGGESFMDRQGAGARGAFTVQYPFEKLPVPENFRCIPFLVYDDETGEHRCTACGICAKACPLQCIWIVRATDAATGRPVPQPAEFYIDASICMSCGSCAEYCPFDAIKMNHDYEIAVYDRSELLYDLGKLTRPAAYHARVHPGAWEAEELARAAKRRPKGGGER